MPISGPPKSGNLAWHDSQLAANERAELLGQRGAVVWFTGLPASGKSTIARDVEALLVRRGIHAYVLDGDNVRHGLNRDLGFSPADRQENVRRIGEVAKLFADADIVALAAFISPYRRDRDAVRELIGPSFFEIHVATALEACEARDPKGLYARARSGELEEFTGVSAPYEAPENAELVLDTARLDREYCARAVVELLKAAEIIR
ncbi:MAG: adenylyl-sulfate kinase [Myxococcales bacterium]|nr:adenylyl-sulfate kinase [Myxococcales bacterium]